MRCADAEMLEIYVKMLSANAEMLGLERDVLEPLFTHRGRNFGEFALQFF
jgi:hypothetical protein